MTSALINQRQDVEKYASFYNLILEKWKQDWTQNVTTYHYKYMYIEEIMQFLKVALYTKGSTIY